MAANGRWDLIRRLNFKEDEFTGEFASKGCVENSIPSLLWSKTLKRIDNVYDLVLNIIIILN